MDLVICTPPCSSWSRARYSNTAGPRLVRSREFPWGFPWLRGHSERKAHASNVLILFSLRLARLCAEAATSVRFVLVLPEARQLVVDFPIRLCSVAFYQCHCLLTSEINERGYAKPTRLLSDIPGRQALGSLDWPHFDEFGKCLGPLASPCGHAHASHLVLHRSRPSSSLTAAGAWPPP